MKAVRLNTNYRQAIRAHLIGDRFEKERQELQERLHDLAINVYNDVFDEATVRRMQRLPEGWLPTVRNVAVEFGGDYNRLSFPDKVYKRMPASRVEYGDCICLRKYPGSHEFSQEHTDIRNRRQAIKEEERQLIAEIDGVLYSVHTDKKLIEVWPEIKTVVEAACSPQGGVQLPAPRINHLNNVLGLKGE